MMKKTLFIALLMLGACTGEEMAAYVPQGDAAATTTKGRLNACILEQAKTKVSDGSVLTQGIKATASEISSACIQKLALQSAGLDTQATQNAQSTLQSLMDLKNAVTGTAAQ